MTAARRRVLACAVAQLGVLAAIAGAAGGASVELTLVAADGTEIAEAVLAAYPLPAPPPPRPGTVVLDQRERKFVPAVLPVQTGTRVAFHNNDDVSHHVYSFSPARRFQLFLPKRDEEQTVEFARPGVVTLGCNLHDWMLGYILVVDTPYFATTDEHGRARLEDLPGGRYRLEVWHPRVTEPAERLRREVTLAEREPTVWQLRLAQPLLPARHQKPALEY
jgi:plastocyanin